MPTSWVYWLAIAVPLGALFYLWLRHRTLHGRASDLSTELERRAAELGEAQETLNRLAGVDATTSLANQRSFEEFLRGECRRASREASSVSVLMIDVDRFSEYTNRLGPQAGDGCLAKIGRQIEEIVKRPGDLVSRHGSEQFGVVMSRTDEDGALRVAQRIRAAIEGLGIEHPEPDVSACVTVSIGVATATPAADSNGDERALAAGATAALERARTVGRNRVAAAQGEPADANDSPTPAGS